MNDNVKSIRISAFYIRKVYYINFELCCRKLKMALKKRSYMRRRDKQWFDIFASFTFKNIMKYM